MFGSAEKGEDMQQQVEVIERRTTTDIVFETLHREILSLDLLPGTKLSEVEIARRFGVSRQPVRDAFSKLEAQDLLLIRPQKATKVRGFSMALVAHSRFVRLAIELEVLRAACLIWDDARDAALRENIAEQEVAVKAGTVERFHKLDYGFHKLICTLGGLPLAFDSIQECKKKIDRLCVLSLGRGSEANVLLADHIEIADALKTRNPDAATATARRHLGRLDETIMQIYEKHHAFFEDPPQLVQSL